MTIRKLRRKLFGFSWYFIPIAIIVVALTLAAFMYSVYSRDLVSDEIFYFLLPFGFAAAAGPFVRRADIKHNRSILSDKEALQSAVDEYNGPEGLHLKNGRKMDDALLPSYILLPSAGVVLRYESIAKAHVVQYNFLKWGGRKVKITRIFTLIKTDGEKIDLFEVKSQEDVEAAVKYIGERNPECKVSAEVEEIKRS